MLNCVLAFFISLNSYIGVFRHSPPHELINSTLTCQEKVDAMNHAVATKQEIIF